MKTSLYLFHRKGFGMPFERVKRGHRSMANKILGFIRILFNRCPLCGARMYWWGCNKGYCTKCEYKVKLLPL